MNVTCYKPFKLLDVSEKITIYRMLIGGETTWENWQGGETT